MSMTAESPCVGRLSTSGSFQGPNGSSGTTIAVTLFTNGALLKNKPMIKLIHCVRRKPQLAATDFRNYWDRYIVVWQELAGLSEAKRMVTSIGLNIDQNTSIQLVRGTREPFDGVLEVWWTSGEQVVQYIQDPALKEKLAAMRLLQEEFIDLTSSSFFFASEEEHVVGK